MEIVIGMISVDTNVLARYFLKDDLVQWEVACRLIEQSQIYVPASVILELVWLLEKRYRVPPPQVRAAIVGLLEAQSVTVENGERLLRTISAQRDGLDFADALHLMSSQGCESLATFDQAFIKAAQPAQTPIPVTHP